MVSVEQILDMMKMVVVNWGDNMNNKGFMMAEVVVVASVVLVTLVSFYSSYNKIISLYNKRVDYYDVDTLYELANIRDNNLDDLLFNEKNNISGNVIFYVNKDSVKNKIINTDDINPTFKDYIEYLSTSIDFDNMKINDFDVENILIMEKCTGTDNCKYAYLEVLNDV